MYLTFHSVPRSKHTVSVIKTNSLLLVSETIVVSSEMCTERSHCGQNVLVEYVNDKCGGM
jgi:hypothetical protein